MRIGESSERKQWSEIVVCAVRARRKAACEWLLKLITVSPNPMAAMTIWPTCKPSAANATEEKRWQIADNADRIGQGGIKSFSPNLKNRRRDQKFVGAELDRGGMSG